MKSIAEMRSSEAASWRRRCVTGTLSAASVRCPMVPVSSRPWRDWKRRIAAVTLASKTSPRGVLGREVVGDGEPLAQQRHLGTGRAGRELRDVRRQGRPAAADLQRRVAQHGGRDAPRGVVVVGRMRRIRDAGARPASDFLALRPFRPRSGLWPWPWGGLPVWARAGPAIRPAARTASVTERIEELGDAQTSSIAAFDFPRPQQKRGAPVPPIVIGRPASPLQV